MASSNYYLVKVVNHCVLKNIPVPILLLALIRMGDKDDITHRSCYFDKVKVPVSAHILFFNPSIVSLRYVTVVKLETVRNSFSASKVDSSI